MFINRVRLALLQVPQQPGVNGSECQSPITGHLAGSINMLKNPGDFSAGEVGIEQEPRSLAK
jgi:hypothetical protein